MAQSHEETRALLNAQAGKIQWNELEKHFARGALVKVTPDLDLIEVAACVVEDDKTAIQQWMHDGKVANATTDDARDWAGRDPVFWAVVAAPLVLVQEVVA